MFFFICVSFIELGLKKVYIYIHTHTHTHTHRCIYIYKYTHTYIHIYKYREQTSGYQWGGEKGEGTIGVENTNYYV